jgi:hypothetical protein
VIRIFGSKRSEAAKHHTKLHKEDLLNGIGWSVDFTREISNGYKPFTSNTQGKR